MPLNDGWCSILQLLRKAEKEFPDRPAIRDTGGRTLTYAQLYESVRQLAHLLRNRVQITPDSLIGLYTHRSIDTVISMLAIMEAGAGFVPIDPAYPPARVRYMLKQARPLLLITDQGLAQNVSGTDINILTLHDMDRSLARFEKTHLEPLPQSTEEDIAYVIFTSGTTGQPKGVLVPHRAATAFLEGMIERPGLSCHDRLLTNASISFDMTIYELFLPLAVGAEMIMTSREVAGDGDRLVQALRDHQVTSMIATPSTWRLILNAGWQGQKNFKVVCGGEAFPRDLANQLCAISDSVWNIYGPTETTVICLVEQVYPGRTPVLLGFPTARTKLYQVNADGSPTPPGDMGELLIGGPQVSRGYLFDDERTAQKFIKNPFHGHANAPVLYRSGDLVRMLPDGNLEYHGRIDHQVKIRGFRVELGEIETTIARWSEIRFNHVLVREDTPDDKRIVAYVTLRHPQTKLSLSSLLCYLRDYLPDYMVPHHIVVVEELPLNANGKIDVTRLPRPLNTRSDLIDPIIPPTTPLEQTLMRQFADILRYDHISIDDNLFELGLNSMMTITCIGLLRAHGMQVTAAQVYEYQTVAAIAAQLAGARKTNTTHPKEPMTALEPSKKDARIAIIGMAGRFPKCNDIKEFWRVLCHGEEALDVMSPMDISTTVPPDVRNNPAYVPIRGILNGIESFDAKFFAVAPAEAAMIDPQQRVFLEESWHALEDSGYDPGTYAGRIGVFAGMHRSSYFAEVRARNPSAIEKFGDFNTMVATEKDYIASRVAYRLNLTGPAVSVHTACSTSLVAIIQAVNALRAGQCEMAIAGGASITVPQRTGHLYQADNIQSRDGHCKPFAADATGTIFSDGVGVVVLKPLATAQADGDHIYAVIRGVGINNDGREKSSFMAPSSTGQESCITAAIQDASIATSDVLHVEAHGTGTIIGDPIETTALKSALTTSDETAHVTIGSLKGNFGHMVAAAGVASIIKVALSLKNEVIPPSINIKDPNIECGFDKKFKVQDALSPWPKGKAPVAGVSSFGVGGTNAHVILERMPQASHRGPCDSQYVIVPVSARSQGALTALSQSVREHFEHLSMGWQRVDAAWTMQASRSHHTERTFQIIANDESLRHQNIPNAPAVSTRSQPRGQSLKICFMFPGQGSQYVGMAHALYENDNTFRQSLDPLLAHLESKHGVDLRDLLVHPAPHQDTEALRDTRLAQPAIFAVSLALAQSWIALGISPSCVIGHSIGEFVAAVIAGIMNPLDAMDFIAHRAAITGRLPAGSMLAVRQSPNELSAIAVGNIKIAAINGPKQTILAGPSPEIHEIASRLSQDRIACSLLETSHAFHSSMMKPAVPQLRNLSSHMKLSVPRIPFISAVTGQILAPEKAMDPNYWAEHVEATVNFYGAAEAALNITPLFLEIGPRGALSGMLRQINPTSKPITSLSTNGSCERDYAAYLQAVGNLWQNGHPIAWKSLGQAARARRTSTPLYPFDQQRHWLLPDDHIEPKE